MLQNIRRGTLTEFGIYRTLQADERPTDASEMANRCFKSHNVRLGCGKLSGGTKKADRAKLPGVGNSPEAKPMKTNGRKKEWLTVLRNSRGENQSTGAKSKDRARPK